MRRKNQVANGTRTRDHRDHNPGLYQLSYRHRALDRIAGSRGAYWLANGPVAQWIERQASNLRAEVQFLPGPSRPRRDVSMRADLAWLSQTDPSGRAEEGAPNGPVLGREPARAAPGAPGGRERVIPRKSSPDAARCEPRPTGASSRWRGEPAPARTRSEPAVTTVVNAIRVVAVFNTLPVGVRAVIGADLSVFSPHRLHVSCSNRRGSRRPSSAQCRA